MVRKQANKKQQYVENEKVNGWAIVGAILLYPFEVIGYIGFCAMLMMIAIIPVVNRIVIGTILDESDEGLKMNANRVADKKMKSFKFRKVVKMYIKEE